MKKGMEQRVEAYKEQIRCYQYMVSKGMVKEAKTKQDFYNTISSFKSMTNKHPTRDIAGALQRMKDSEKANRKKKNGQDDMASDT